MRWNLSLENPEISIDVNFCCNCLSIHYFDYFFIIILHKAFWSEHNYSSNYISLEKPISNTNTCQCFSWSHSMKKQQSWILIVNLHYKLLDKQLVRLVVKFLFDVHTNLVCIIGIAKSIYCGLISNKWTLSSQCYTSFSIQMFQSLFFVPVVLWGYWW
jgi:hypothetical protein